MANNTASKVIDKGSVWFRMANGRSMTLTKVRHVPNLRKNLISIGMLDSKGCSFDTSGGTLRVSKGNKEMLWRKKIGGLYRLEGKCPNRGSYYPTWMFGQTRVVQPVQDVPERSLEEKNQVNFEKLCAHKGRGWSHDNSQSDVFCGGAEYEAPGGGDAGHLGEKILWGSWIKSCQDRQLEDIGLPSSGLEGEIVESSPSG
ncbi:hypothetical protein Acr_24g0007940 [Actinidia rufa]|uniref:Retrovirus-related Pol polyprotein from transposon TNT 1-94-like beta-barrel domain-containing protein n=1 Tax=Actinidia rufa TaxID=165716 RepID=A0A7J0GVR7_9ERIC|nr:hypothetical protein Acr_24g0007940 [Actinidia rufa]